MLRSLRRGGPALVGYGYGYGCYGGRSRPARRLLARALCTGGPSSSLSRWLAARGDGDTASAGPPIKWYACGPTVYDVAHLGHARTYVSQDVIRRVLEGHCGRSVFFVMGMTDVDDKIISRARDRGEDPVTLARRYEAEFWEDMRALNVEPPDAVARVTEHMDAIVDYIAGIERNGLAYRTRGSGVYFDVGAFAKRFSYGKLGQEANVQGEGEGGTASSVVVGQEEKRDPRDFVLWKPAKAGEPAWPSPWGAGRPGWHIECSAMTHHLLGDRVDIHSGGIDLKFPHHTNELAQCEAFLGAEDPPWVGAWLHTGHLYIKGLKMSKSLKNFITVRDCLEGQQPGQHFPDDFRLFCCLRRFRANADYSEDAITEARALRQSFLSFLAAAQQHLGPSVSFAAADKPEKKWGPREFSLQAAVDEARAAVDVALRSDDVDTPEALRALQGLVGAGNRYLLQQQQQQGEGGAVGEAVGNAARCVSRALTLLGLTSHLHLRAPGGGEGYASAQEVAGALVDFRARVRGLALAALQQQKGEALSQRLLALCDDARDGEPWAALGLVVKDAQGAKPAVWTLEAKRARSAPPAPSPQQAPTPAHSPPLAAVGLRELFRQGPYEGQFSAFDAAGIPTHDAAGQPISKRLRAKLERKHAKHRGRLRPGDGQDEDGGTPTRSE